MSPLKLYTLAHSPANLQFPILTWEEFGFVEPSVHAVLGQAGVECADGVTVRVGVAEEDFEGAGRHKDELGRMKDEKTTRL